MRKKILLISGDPISINSELIFKSWKRIDRSLRKKIVIISNHALLKKQFKKLKYSIKIREIKDIEDVVNYDCLNVINVDLKFKNPFKIEKKNCSEFVVNSLKLSHKLALSDNVMGIINCPIDKGLLNQNKIGVTEYLANLCNLKNKSEAMLISNSNLSVSPITTHIDIKDISRKLNSKIIVNKIKTIDSWYFKKLKKHPKIALLGLNPHNGELRSGSEEKKIIVPAISKLKNLGLNIKGPFAADTLFMSEYKKYDIIVGMFHDQVLTPFKTLFGFDAINITLGLKYLRVSPDHGTATNIIGKNKANTLSLFKCIHFINKNGK